MIIVNVFLIWIVVGFFASIYDLIVVYKRYKKEKYTNEYYTKYMRSATTPIVLAFGGMLSWLFIYFNRHRSRLYV